MTKQFLHADIVGSFLRPEDLKQAHADFAAGKLDAAGLKQVQNKDIQELVQAEVAAGLKAVTDGEFSRSWWHLDFLWGLNGTERYDYNESYKFKGSKTRTDNVRLTGKIAYNPEHPFFEAFKYLQSVTPAGVVPKQTIPSPTMLFRDN